MKTGYGSTMVLTTLVAVLALACPGAAEWENYPATDLLDDVSARAECLLVQQAPSLDGVADEAIWAQARPVTAWIDPVGYRNHTTQVPFEARFIYDRESVYVYFETAPVPDGLELPAPSTWYVTMVLDPRPDHINTPELRFNANGTATLGISTWKSNFREDECKTLPQPTGETVIADGRLHGEFAIPMAGLMADRPEMGDAWDLDMLLQAGRGGVSSRWGTEFIPGRLRFVSEPSPEPHYVVTRPQVLVTPHHGTFYIQATVERRTDGPAPTEITVEGITGRQRGERTTQKVTPADIGKPISLEAMMPEPGLGALRFQLLRGTEVMDTLVVPVEIDSDLPRFAATPGGSMDCYVGTFTVRPGEKLEGALAFVPAHAGGRAQVAYRVQPIETVGPPAPMGAMATVELGGDGPLVVPLAVEVADLPCGSYSLAGTFECEGQTRQFESQSFNVAGDFVTKYDQWMDEWKARVEALRNRQIKYPFQLEFAEMALHLLGRHGSQELQKASPGLAQRRPWWPINWAVQLDGMLDALEADRDYFANRSGILLGGYRSKVDGTLQPYEITLPEGYDRSKKWPTLFAIHGTSSHYYYSLVALVERGYQPITKWPMICVGLDGRAGPTPHGGLADVDFLEVYEQLRQHLGLDTERVYMTGYSRGGMATWYYAVQLPYMFAAVSPCAPFGYASTGELANVRHMPVNSYHGVHDPRTANANGPMMIGALNSLEGKGYHMQIRVAGHDLKAGYRDRAFMERLLAVKAPAYPKDVEFVCDRPRYSRAYWVNIDRMIDYGRSAHVKVNVVAARTIAVNTDNVGALTLDLSGGQVDKGAPLRIVLNGEERSMEYADQLRIQIQPADGALVKTPELGGPIGDWMFEKSLIVYGTQANENTAAAYKKLAEQISTGGTRTRWLYVHDTESQWPIKADSEVTADDVRDANLVLLGGPGGNSVSTRIADRLPLKFQSDRLSVGDVVVNGPDAEVLFIYPNPQNRRRYVVVLGVADPNIKPSAGASGFKSLTSDLVIVRGKTDERLPGRLCFDAGWQFQPPETLYQVPAGIKADWRELLLDAAKAETGADVTFRLSYDRARPISEGPLYYADVLSGVTDAALIAIEMTGAEFESYLQSWITFYGKPPLLRGMDLEWSIDPASHVARVEKTGLDPKRSYTIVSDEVSASRPTWDVPEHVQYHLLPINSADVVVRYLQAGKLKSPQ